MIKVSPRLFSVAGAISLGMLAAAPAAASPIFLTLGKSVKELGWVPARQTLPVYDFFWAPYHPRPFFLGISSYLIMPGSEWASGSPVDNGMLAVAVRPGSCRVGALYQAVELQIGGYVHRLRDVSVTGCKPVAGALGETEWMTVAFAKVD